MIRDFERGDQAAFREIVLSGMRERWGAAFDPAANPDVDDIWANYVEAREATVLVYELDGEVVGTGLLAPEDPDTGRLYRMSVAARVRRRGIARALTTELLRRAAERSMRRVVVSTDTPWTDAVALYLSCGFEIIGQTERGTQFGQLVR